LRKAVIQAAKDLNYSNDVKAHESAFDKVGIVDDTVVNKPPADLPTNPGGWGMLICNTDPKDRNSLYKTSDYKNLMPISTTEMASTPSVTDDGKFTIFADGKNNIRILDMTSGKESYFNEEGDNQSVAISRDGKRVAVISTAEDGRIWVYDINTKKWMAFKLYNPTTGTGGARGGGPRYADAIEFDHTGEYILYDAYNTAGSSIGGRTVDYWDIGMIHVWNNSRNVWGTGEVVKLFSDLSSGVNIMNPVFSKNSPFIIAFDFYDEEDGNFTFCLNLATGDIDGFENNMPSYPSYSMDDKRIAFTTYNYYSDKDYNVGYFNLSGNKISVTGNENVFVSGGAYPIYYGTGTRVLGAKPVASFTSDARSGGRPLNVQFVDMSDGNPTSWRWTFTGGSPSSSTQQHPKVTYSATGTYPVTLVATNSYGSGEVVRQGYITVGTTDAEVVVRETVAVYPNPANDHVWIFNASDKITNIKLFDLTGKAIQVLYVNEQGQTRVDVSRLYRGIYVLQVTLSDGKTLTQKIVKQ
jgi:PKD repeat protein